MKYSSSSPPLFRSILSINTCFNNEEYDNFLGFFLLGVLYYLYKSRREMNLIGMVGKLLLVQEGGEMLY
ncbi:hypothetical protein WQ54_09220 [Bacillus sp. SA1-12]|nr:hypothetical protein WQ54_09220 [Bacillus sp. SA1-12]